MELYKLPCVIHKHKDMVRESAFCVSPAWFPLLFLVLGDNDANGDDAAIVSNMINKLQGQPQSYDKKWGANAACLG